MSGQVLGRENADEDEQAGEDKGSGRRMWKEWARRWNFRCRTQERGGRDDEERDEEDGRRGVRGRGETRSGQGDDEEEDEEEGT